MTGPQLYSVAWMPRQNGNYGSRHILEAGTKRLSLCGLQGMNWRHTISDDRNLESVYRSLEQLAKKEVRHQPNRPLTPCRRCMAAAQKLRDPLDRMSDIEM